MTERQPWRGHMPSTSSVGPRATAAAASRAGSSRAAVGLLLVAACAGSISRYAAMTPPTSRDSDKAATAKASCSARNSTPLWWCVRTGMRHQTQPGPHPCSTDRKYLRGHQQRL
mmetsp:Transcript_10378/g.23454  ORF Transcript_10378/g.23454 Transcript_10378/m.23454 type:complete len:114 (-) Transcript_10378:207-548(-)